MNRCQWTDNDTPGIYWCSYCGKDIWLPPEQAKTPEQFICYECKRVLDTYDPSKEEEQQYGIN